MRVLKSLMVVVLVFSVAFAMANLIAQEKMQEEADEKANALEYLDNLLASELKVVLLPILDDIPLNHKVRQGRALFNLEKLSRKQALSALLEGGDLWLETCTVYSLRRERMKGFEAEVSERLNSTEKTLKETAERYLELLDVRVN